MNKLFFQTPIVSVLKISILSLVLLSFLVSAAYAARSSGQNTQARPGTHAVTSDRNLANQTARDMNSRPNSMPSNHEAVVTSNRDGTVSVSVRERDRGGDGGSTSAPGPSRCNSQPNLQTIDIFFVPAGAQPRTVTPSRRPSNSILASVVQNPYQNIMVARNELEVGVSYEPIAMIRNVSACRAQIKTSSSLALSQLLPDWRLLFTLPTAQAGGRPSGSFQPNDYPNYFRTQLPFGSNGSFPIRARIDVGTNGTTEWEQYINAFGPVGSGQTIYLRLPSFTTSESGSHRIEIVTDIRHSIDPGRTCYATTTPASSGWGCVRETRETDNDRSENFTTRVGSTSLQLAVDVSDVVVRAGSVVSEIPFMTINNGRADITNYRYRVTVGASQYASGTRTTNLTPTSRETVRAAGSYTAPATPTSIPLTVCARVATSSDVCDTARVIVATPECSDSRDNDSDSTRDTTDASCFTDPLDPSTYDPDDNNESDLSSTSASVTIEFKPVTNPVRYDTGATLAYTINGPAPMSCIVTGGGTNSSITHTPPRTTGQVTTAPVTSTQQYTLRCTATVGGGTLQFERTTTVDVLPLIQET